MLLHNDAPSILLSMYYVFKGIRSICDFIKDGSWSTSEQVIDSWNKEVPVALFNIAELCFLWALFYFKVFALMLLKRELHSDQRLIDLLVNNGFTALSVIGRSNRNLPSIVEEGFSAAIRCCIDLLVLH